MRAEWWYIMLRNRTQIVTCNCEGMVFKGTIEQVIINLEGFGYGAQKAGEFDRMHNFFQHAEHYKRVLKGE